ncbi:MAG: 2-oxoglutarate dehydrogenase E1 component [Myxococcales bacterium]|nr:2-oxoglutarate dehydrogenase E1 component [Myxococcales bacterium]
MPQDLLGLAASRGFLDEIYDTYRNDPASVDESWRELLASEEAGAAAPSLRGRFPTVTLDQPAVLNGTNPSNGRRTRRALRALKNSSGAVASLINAFRSHGHLIAELDPLGLMQPPAAPELTLGEWGLAPDDEVSLPLAGFSGQSAGELERFLKQTYAGALGLEFMHIPDARRRSWLAERMETRHITPLAADVRRTMLQYLVNAEGFERFCHVKYPGTKRFSLEGSESLVPLLDLALTRASELGSKEAVIGMAHRGRLTALETILKRPARDIFSEFEDVEPEAQLGGGDVKYHLGYSTDRTYADGRKLHLSLAFNPSHLEAVDPVVLGRVRAKQSRSGEWQQGSTFGVLVHGDAAFAGQGLVAECFNLMGLPGYRTGGTLHVVVNNQVGFTASPQEARSTPYCTDIAKMVDVPVWHVNGEDLDEVAHVVTMAMEYRHLFQSDVIIDLYCYRRYGHNEMDEPGFTQPLMYDRIQQKSSVVELYSHVLTADGVLADADVKTMVATRHAALEVELAAGKSQSRRPRTQAMAGVWQNFAGGPYAAAGDVDTGVSREDLLAIATQLTAVPADFSPHPKLLRLLEQRAQMGRGERPIDWGMGEMLAYGSLIRQGTNVRLSGQDSARGTFSHRHAHLADIKTGLEHNTLLGFGKGGAAFKVFDSPLSEAGVMGFEYGYSLDAPDHLVMWEAQFGDFANGAQVIVDQFLVASEDKWNRLSGLVLLLPHGFEGQGPEHSSARLERFLQSCAEDNIQVVQPTTTAQMFHLLRRQIMRPWRKPLIVMTPKSLLRLPAAASPIEDLTSGRFQNVMVDPAPGKTCERVVFCSGKIYYELAESRAARGAQSTAIVRMEQLYPWPEAELRAALATMPKAKEFIWVQDEPGNMGAQFFTVPRLSALAGKAVTAISRDDSGSPATGSHKAHAIEQERILSAAFGKVSSAA